MKVLHAGCGGEKIPDIFNGFEEVRLDINPAMKPDVVASLIDMGDIGPFDAAYCSHTLEHLYPHQVNWALREFYRVLAPHGYLMLIVPDLQDVRPTTEIVYESPSGPVCGLDMFYGGCRLIQDNPWMAHHCGFTSETLTDAMHIAGYPSVRTERSNFNLVAIARKQ